MGGFYTFFNYYIIFLACVGVFFLIGFLLVIMSDKIRYAKNQIITKIKKLWH